MTTREPKLCAREGCDSVARDDGYCSGVCWNRHEANLCARCGQPAKGQAVIDIKRYCHDGDDPTCYMLESWELAGKPRFKARLCPKHGIYRDATKESVIND